MNTQELQISARQAEALERIARENRTQPEELVRLALQALIAEAKRHEGRLTELYGELQRA